MCFNLALGCAMTLPDAFKNLTDPRVERHKLLRQETTLKHGLKGKAMSLFNVDAL